MQHRNLGFSIKGEIEYMAKAGGRKSCMTYHWKNRDEILEERRKNYKADYERDKVNKSLRCKYITQRIKEAKEKASDDPESLFNND
jgi:hypothetical protein